MSHVTHLLSPVTCSMSHVTCHISPVTCQQWQQPEPHILPLLTPPLYTVDWFTKTDPKNPPKKCPNPKSGQNIKKKYSSLFKRVSYTPFDQKSPALLVSVDDSPQRIAPFYDGRVFLADG